MKNQNRHLLTFVLFGLGLIWVVFLFFQYTSSHDTYSISFNLFDTVIPDLVLLGVLALLAYALGRKIIILILKHDPPSGIDFVFSSATGFIVLSLATTLCAFLHLLTFPVMIILLVVLILVSAREINGAMQRIHFLSFRKKSRFEGFLTILLVAFILVNLCFALAPPFGLDEQQYHLTALLRYIENGGYYRITNIGSQVNYPQNAEMLYALAMVVRGDVLAKLVNFYFGILILFLIMAFCRRFFRFRAILPLTVFYGSWVIFYVSTRANVELAQAFYDGVCLLSLVIGLNQMRRKKRWEFYFFFSAVCGGFALGVKYISLFSLVGLLVLFTYYSFLGLRLTFARWLKLTCIYAVIVLFLFSPWMIKNVIYFRMPFYPHRVTTLISLATGLFKGGDSPESSPSYMQRRGMILHKTVYPEYSIRELLLVPYNATIYGEWGNQVFDTLLSPFYLMFLPFLIFIRRKHRLVKGLILYIVTFYIIWLFLQPNSRYLVPIMPVMAILVGYVMHKMAEFKDAKTRAITWILRLIIGLVLVLGLFHHFLILVRQDPVSYLFGLENKTKFLERNNPAGIQSVINHANRKLPPSSKIYLLWEKRGYYLEDDYQEDSFGNIFANLMDEYRDPKAVAGALKQMGFTHILCDYYIPGAWFGSSYQDSKINKQAREIGQKELNFFREMAGENLTQLTKKNTIHLFKID